jgi:apolipoprotein N-acyltransferase
MLAGAGHALIARRRTAVLALPLLITATEFLASRRFLWGDAAYSLVAYTQAFTGLKPIAAWSGTSGVTFALVATGCAAYWLTRGQPRAAVWTGVGLAAVLLIPTPGRATQEASASITVGVVQVAADPVERTFSLYDDGLMAAVAERFERQSREAVARGADLVVWGETTLPEGSNESGPNIWMRAALDAAPVVIAGAIESSQGAQYNSAFVWRGQGLELLSRKQALVRVYEDSYTRGTPVDPVPLQGALVATQICLDSMHGSLARESVRRGADLLVYITDDTFAGTTATPHHHLTTAILRAAEVGRSVVFANESGPSALILPTGEVVTSSAQGEPAVLVASLPLSSGITPYTALGDWFGAAACVIALLVVMWAVTRRARVSPRQG